MSEKKKPTTRKLTAAEKKHLQSAFEVALVDCTPDKEWLVVVRVGTDSFPADRETMRVVLQHIDRLKREGYIPEEMRVVVVPHVLQFTREALSEVEIITPEE